MSQPSPTVLCTGGLGYIGSHTVAQLVEEGYDVVIVDSLVKSTTASLERLCKTVNKKIPFYKVDLCVEAELNEVFKKHKIDFVIHFAGLKAVAESVQSPLSYYSNNIVGTINLLKAMQAANCKNLVFSSSAAVYQVSIDAKFYTENSPLSPGNPYGRTKAMIEQMLQDLHESDKTWSIIMLRYFNPVGAHRSGLLGNASKEATSLLPVLQKVAHKKKPYLEIFGGDYDTKDGTGVRDYIHIDDLVDGHVVAAKLLMKAEYSGKCDVFNLGTGVGTSVMELVHNYEEVSGLSIPFVITDRRPGDAGCVVATPTKANNELNWFAKRTIREACESALRFAENNPNEYS